METATSPTKKRNTPSPKVSPKHKEPRTALHGSDSGNPGPSTQFTDVILITCPPNGPVVNPMFDAADPLSRYKPIKVRKVRSSDEWF